MDDDKPMGYWKRKHVATDPRWTKHYSPASLAPMLVNAGDGFPNLPGFLGGGEYLYSPDAVDKFFSELEVWTSNASARAEAKRLDAQRRAIAEMEREQAAIRLQQELIRASNEAQAKAHAAFEAQGEEIRKEIERTARVQAYARGERTPSQAELEAQFWGKNKS